MPEPAAAHRPELLAALRLLAAISGALHRRGLPRPILVGGAAAEYFTGGALMTGGTGQFSSGSAPEMLEQARLLFALNPALDIPYLERRIRDETAGDHGVQDLR